MRSQTIHPDDVIGLRYELPKCYPFVKWAGGKTQLLSKLYKYFPTKITRYFEPFVGGGAVFFYLVSQKNSRVESFLSDINEELIIAYKTIRDHVEELITILKIHEMEYKKFPTEYYYKLRTDIKTNDDIERTARFITLNKTCYNGLYRVNKNGIFNVPIGRYKNPIICDSANLQNISIILNCSNTNLYIGDYKNILLEKTLDGDFIYLDPPYYPISVTSNFTSYTNNGFTTKDQEELSKIFKKLTDRGCQILLSNSDSEYIRELYSEFKENIIEVKVQRAINSKASKRKGHTELIIRNY
ncbi:MAG: DNA adenine methylase [Nitrososphaeraceae archaeon]